MDKSSIIEKYIGAIGNDCTIKDKDNNLFETKCIIIQLWKNIKTVFEYKHTEIGLTGEYYYRVLFPKSCDVMRFDSKATVTIKDKDYCFVRQEPFCISNNIQYYTCVVKEIFKGDDYCAFEG